MKNILRILILGIGIPAAFAQQPEPNYIIGRTYKQSGANTDDVSQVTTEIQYFDGFGRSMQKVLVGQSRDGKDIVRTVSLDAAGRPKMVYLPYEGASATGKYRDSAPADATTWYDSNAGPQISEDRSKPYVETFYDTSPLNRQTGEQGPANKSKRSEIKYKVNTGNLVKSYSYDPANGSITENGYFAAGRLTQLNYKDEQDHVTNEFTDKNGRVICKMVESGGATLSTYYVYNVYGDLSVVLQPNYQSDPDKARFAFVYDYDSYGRMITKAEPGGGIVEYVYDKYDRPLLTRDARQSAGGVWGFTKYDALNRPIATGEISSALGRAQWQDNINNATTSPHHEARNNGTVVGYTLNQLEPKTATESDLLTITFYDDYAFQAPNLSFNSASANASNITSAKSLVTGTRAKVLPGDPNGTARWLSTVTYYDAEYRPIQVVRQLYNLGTDAIERVSTQYKYNIARVISLLKTEQILSGTTATTIHTATYTYDHADRLLNVKEYVKNGTNEAEAFTVAQRYNAIGQLKSKWLHSDDNQKYRHRTDYTYNIRGWLTEGKTMYRPFENSPQEKQYFSFGLQYNAGTNFTNGNISAMEWNGKDKTAFDSGMDFQYDGANRLKEATGRTYSQVVYPNTETGITYDNNGNLLTLTRAGVSKDNLTFQYSGGFGNKLYSVTDGSSEANTAVKAGESKYTYDAIGNMLTDANRGATITYNSINLPKKVVLGTGATAKNLFYDYDASGVKHQYISDLSKDKYAGSIQYREENNANTFVRAALTDGQAVLRSNKIKFQYYLKDHLGNVRVVFDEFGAIQQRSDYYPFGMEIAKDDPELTAGERNTANRYLYNSKEKQQATNWLDYGARMYMPEIGRWGAMDPLIQETEHFSPYAFTNNNPVTMVDMDGQYTVLIHYRLTYKALVAQGYSRKQADLIAHYASTYADHPEPTAMFLDVVGHLANPSVNPLAYRMSSGIDYNKTVFSQEEYNSRWHSMMSDDEARAGMTEEEAMNRGLKFGWDNIFASGGGEDLGKLGQGLHALQDAYAHHGMRTNDHLGYNLSSAKQTLFRDMYGSTKDAAGITRTALVVTDLLRGRKPKLRNGDRLDVKGMSSEQLSQMMELLIRQGFRGTIQTN